MPDRSPELHRLARHLAGEFDNRDQALADPAWYVRVRLWQRPVPDFGGDGIALYLEQISVIQGDRPYRPRLVCLRDSGDADAPLRADYYKLKRPETVLGAGRDRARLAALTPDTVERLPGCSLQISIAPAGDRFRAWPAPGDRCRFSVEGRTVEIALGFEAMAGEFWSYDKGIDPDTGRATWGALAGPFRFRRTADFADELPARQA